MKKFLYICICLSLFLILPAQAEGRIEKKQIMVRTLLRYEVIISNSGTRSEGLSGKLFIGNYEVPGIFDSVEAYGILYTYTPLAQTWQWYGFTPQKVETIREKTDLLWNEIDNQKGWYEGTNSLPKNRMPVDWIFIKKGPSGVWIAPDKLASYVATIAN